MLERAFDSYDLKKFNKVKLSYDLKNHKSVRETDYLVEQLLERYGNSEFKPLFRKVAWYLPEATINNFIEKAAGATKPCNYFVKCAKNELIKVRMACLKSLN